MGSTMSRFFGVFFLSAYFLVLTSFFSGCSGEKYLLTSDKVEIAYDYEEVPNEKGTAVLLHGLGSNLDEWYTFKRFMTRNGWSTLAIDLRGHGYSNYFGDEELDWRNFTDKGFLSSLRDVEAAVRFLGEKENVWIIGASFGANLGLVYAAQEPRIDGMILLSPGFEYVGIESESVIEPYGSRPIMIVGAEDDPGAVSIGQILHDKAQGPRKLLAYEKGGHANAMLENVKELKEEMIAWMNQNLISRKQKPTKR